MSTLELKPGTEILVFTWISRQNLLFYFYCVLKKFKYYLNIMLLRRYNRLNYFMVKNAAYRDMQTSEIRVQNTLFTLQNLQYREALNRWSIQCRTTATLQFRITDSPSVPLQVVLTSDQCLKRWPYSIRNCCIILIFFIIIGCMWCLLNYCSFHLDCLIFLQTKSSLQTE